MYDTIESASIYAGQLIDGEGEEGLDLTMNVLDLCVQNNVTIPSLSLSRGSLSPNARIGTHRATHILPESATSEQ
ncbi:MAG: hypothetical protein U0232_22495 [Thermomicrobiales bacterium]